MRFVLIFSLLLCGIMNAKAQSVAINNDGSAPDPSSILHIKSIDKGILIPRVTQAQRDNIFQPASSLLVFQTDADSGFYYRKGITGWSPLADNLGNHLLVQNLRTDGKYISRAGDNLGIRPWDNGTVRLYGYNSTVGNTWETARIDESGGLVAFGSLGYGIIPATGNGSRMMWYPFKSSFRAGAVDGNTAAWDDANNGFYTGAFGLNTIATGVYAFTAGYNTRAAGTASTALGYGVAATGNYSVAGGYQSDASDIAAVAIGYRDTASGQASVALGYLAKSSGDYSVALGYRPSSNGWAGCFTASDASTTATFNAAGNNQFWTRYSGGYRLYTNATTTIGVNLAAGGNSWTSISDSGRKERFVAADGEQFLQKLRNMRLGSWNYKVQPGPDYRHYGPMAQEFYANFGKDRHGSIGNDTTIASADMDGVLMILVKALEKRTADQATTIEKLEGENAALKKQLAASEKMGGEWEAFKEVLLTADDSKALLEKIKQLALARKQGQPQVAE